jgi:hypothetical protein
MKISSIINEEVTNMVNEVTHIEDDRLKFIQDATANFANYESFSKDFDVNVESVLLRIHWGVNFWVNKSGIANFNVEIEGVEGQYAVQMLNRQTDQVEQEVQKNIADIDWNFQVGDITIAYGGHLYVSDMDFDFKTNTCKVSF